MKEINEAYAVLTKDGGAGASSASGSYGSAGYSGPSGGSAEFAEVRRRIQAGDLDGAGAHPRRHRRPHGAVVLPARRDRAAARLDG